MNVLTYWPLLRRGCSKMHWTPSNSTQHHLAIMLVMHIVSRTSLNAAAVWLLYTGTIYVLKVLLTMEYCSPSLSCLLLQCAVLNVQSTSSSFTGFLDLSRHRSSLNFFDLLDYLQLLGHQFVIYGDLNCPDSDVDVLDYYY